jgi:hypothetical protein
MRCGEVMTHAPEAHCELAMGHRGWHEAELGKHRWTTAERADLERRVKAAEFSGWMHHLGVVLDDLGALHSEAIDEARDALEEWQRHHP